jgi:hypothetical protein
MSAIFEIRVPAAQNNDNLDEIRKIFAKAFWSWLLARWEHRLVTVRILIFKKTVKVKDLASLYEMLFGPNPFSSTG